ncbi:MAG TPA: DinB family protein [Acidobacteriota bacterium]|nr:DinB family protein [Acidobacteriota bacterium]
MKKETNVIKNAMGRALSGEGAHVEGARIFQGMDWKLAGVLPAGVPHTVFQLLNHVTYWQEWGVKWLDGRKPALPRSAALSWPGRPAPLAAREWEQGIKRFQAALENLQEHCGSDLLVSGGQKTRLEMLQTIASHNSYHLGQVALLRQMLGVWPPPGGGLTW